jgi:hypothetical protein
MKNFKYYLTIAILAAGLIFVAVGWYKEHQTTSAFQAKNQKVKEQILTGAKEIARTVKANGAESVLLDITGNHVSNKDVNNTDMPDIIDTAAMALDIRDKQLKEVTVIAAQYKAENLHLKAELDSNRRLFYTYSGNGLDLKFTPPYTPQDLATADFNGKVGITIAKGDKVKWYTPWKAKSLMSVSSDSKFFTIDHVNYIGFDKDPINFHLQAQATTSFNKMTGLGVGPGLKLELGRFDFEGTYQYYQQQRNWMYAAKASFRIAGF